MARVLTIDDYPIYAEMAGEALRRHGHTVLAVIVPFEPAVVQAFGPDVVVVTLIRKIETLGHGPLHDFWTQVDGCKALRTLQAAGLLGAYPLLLTTIGLAPTEIPAELPHAGTFVVPQQLDELLKAIEKY